MIYPSLSSLGEEGFYQSTMALDHWCRIKNSKAGLFGALELGSPGQGVHFCSEVQAVASWEGGYECVGQSWDTEELADQFVVSLVAQAFGQYRCSHLYS